jgi:small-conductance mechanosensitive channel
MLPRYRASLAMMLVGMLASVLFCGLATEVSAQAQPGAASAQDEIATAPVEVDNVVLFRVRGTSSYPAASRADLIRQRITEAASDPAIPLEAFRTAEGEGGSIRIMAGDNALMHVVDADAALEQVGQTALALSHLSRIRQAVASYRAARSPSALRRGAFTALGATLVLAVAIVALLWLWRRLDAFLIRRLRSRIQSVEIQSFEVMRAERIWNATRSALMTIRTVIVLALALVYIGFVLGQFPWTRGLSSNMVTFALGPLQVIGNGIVANIPSLVFLAVLFFVVRVLLRLTRLFFDQVGRGTVKLANFEAEWAEPTYKIVRVAIIAFGLIVAYPYIPGSESAAFKGVSVFIGIVFSLGSSTAIANIVAGYMMTYRRAFKVGDRVKLGDAVGDVLEIRLQVTRLRSPKNEELIIPNSQILSNEVINYSSIARQDGLILHTEVGIGYETPWRQVEAMLIMAAERTSGLTMEPRPFVLEKKLADFAVTYELNVYCRNVPLMARLYAELHRNILDVFNEYGVQIMTPAYEGDPAEPKVVARKDWFLDPARDRDRTPSGARDVAELA